MVNELYIRRSAQEQARFCLETEEILAKYAESGEVVIPLAGDQSKVYLEATLARRWNPRGQQPLVADGARQKQAENIYGALHLGTGAETATFCIDWQDSDATITAHRDSTVEQDSELVHRCAPVRDRHCPPLADVAQRQIHQLEDCLRWWFMPLAFRKLPAHAWSYRNW